jgi:uncharacterized protein (DUF433 family)
MNTVASYYFNDRISIHPDICNGKPTLRGKRITVQTILEFLSAGENPQHILEQYPSLEAEDINACLAFACKLMDHKYILKDVAA